MASEKFDLVFSGAILPNRDIAEVKANMGALFKLPEATIDKLFSGSAIVLKRNLDLPMANKYRVAIKKAGARVDLVKSGEAIAQAKPAPAKPVVASTSTPATSSPTTSSPIKPIPTSTPVSEPNTAALPAQPPKEPYDGKAGEVAPGPQEAMANDADGSWSLQPVGALLSDSQQDDTPAMEIPDFDIAEAGADLIQEHERKIKTPVTVDISGLSVRESEGNLVDESEIQAAPAVHIEDLAADILPAGSDLLSAAERNQHTPVEVAELSADLAPVGARLSEEKKAAAVAPNTDHIQLAD